MSGPIQDRMDILLKLYKEHLDESSLKQNETSEAIRERVERARKTQYERYAKEVCNATVSNELLLAFSVLTSEQEKMVQRWASKYHWSTRAQMRIRRLARTISDLSGDEQITNEAIWEAVTIRRKQDTQTKKGMVK